MTNEIDIKKQMLLEGIEILNNKKINPEYNEEEDLNKLYDKVKNIYPLYEDFFIELNEMLIANIKNEKI